MTDAIATQENNAAMLERVVVGGNLAELTPAQRLLYYRQLCESLGLNPLTQPFEYITLNGKLRLYAKRDATDQLRVNKGVSITKVERDKHSDLYVVTAYATDKDGRTDAATGAVSIAGLRGEALANAIMKAETKAKRRVTLSLCGLGMLDESETESVTGAKIGEPTAVTDISAAREVDDDSDRPFLIKRIKDIAAEIKLPAKDRAAMKAEYLGDAEADLDACAPAALKDLYNALQDRKAGAA